MKTSFVKDAVECYVSVVSEMYTASVFKIAATRARIWSGYTDNANCHSHSHDIGAKYLQHIPSKAEKTPRIKQIISNLPARRHGIAARYDKSKFR
jgi:hypothetical protein